MARIVAAVLALSLLPAFAPAPIPRREAMRTEGLSTRSLQGTWRVMRFETVDRNGTPERSGTWFQKVKIRGGVWTYLVGDKENLSYRITIDASKEPAHMDFFSVSGRMDKEGMVGLVRRVGQQVQILYYATQSEKRARGFEQMPVYWWVLTLEREKR